MELFVVPRLRLVSPNVGEVLLREFLQRNGFDVVESGKLLFELALLPEIELDLGFAAFEVPRDSWVQRPPGF
jgi:hypothetical protein